MALDLTFVEKGPMNNIPVTFLASSPSSHQKLAINGKSNTLVVSPTSSKDTVVTGVITASQCKFNLLVISFHFSLLLSSFMSIFCSLFVSVLFFPSLLFRSCLFVCSFVCFSVLQSCVIVIQLNRLSVLMLCAPVFKFTSGSSALLGRPRCGLSI